MKFKRLGNTNLKVSSICLGTMTWGEQNNQREAFEQMDYATDQGINFLDTAEQYSSPVTKESYGKTETIYLEFNICLIIISHFLFKACKS